MSVLIKPPGLLVLLAAGSLMLSTFRYVSFKRIDLRRKWSYRGALPLVVVLLILTYRPQYFFLVTSLLYGLSGPTSWLTGRLFRREPTGEIAAPEEGTA